ncbi:peptide MFS transporter [Carnobacterium divergens]|uniref:Di-/tripeptide transporter n=1 Tax=Carnobacterium divergens TaxID=2748 RepID=A0A7Z8G468_CARDV|nr:peptide MFS transporter [Carnobacterium divergens]TFI71341.1 peptide ABC transporter permease [Carnobacterium divergens]TFI75983.1 peptide ABC transporter permease [Carnobacterium divergens]TFI81855.1 peptide ABC transporter permease [Carnobacterium divergens]TFI94164.1 peptide ABC transporter permease [Carnobacterium divergens]TFJ10444.1 peptide ABC transporter permease [Carnobacterium divergens]
MKKEKTFFGQPRGLSTLFFTEMWERFSYYGMRAILIYYIYDTVANGGLGFSQTLAASIMAIYGSLVYMSSVIGGWVSDRLLGSRKTIFYGGVLIMVGHIVLATPFGAGALFASIAIIVLGTGMLKPNVSEIVGGLYDKKDNRRDAGFSIFVMGINIGSFLAPYIVGTIGQTYNYHLGFSIAAVGMFVGLIQFHFQGKKYLGELGMKPTNPINENEKKQLFKNLVIGGIVVVAVFVIAFLTGQLTIEFVILLLSIMGVALPVFYFTKMIRSKDVDDTERSRIWAYIPLFIASIFFWSIEEQGSVILAIYADKRTNLDFMGVHLMSSWFQSLNPLFVILMSPIFAWLWTKLGRRQPSTTIKFSVGIVFAGLSFVVMVIPAMMHGVDTRVNPMWLVLSFFLVIIGEMCLSPVGLSVTTKLAPRAFQSQMMSMWFLGDAAAQAINAQIVSLYNPNNEIVYFAAVGGFTVVVGLLLSFMNPKIKTLMRGLN